MEYILSKLGLLIGLQFVNIGAVYLALSEINTLKVIGLNSIESISLIGSLFLLAKINFMLSKFIKKAETVSVKEEY